MSWTLTTSGAAIVKAGIGANSAITISGAVLAKMSDDAEGTLCTLTRKDWVAGYAAVSANFKPILSDCISDMIAMKIIAYDMSGYFKVTEAQTLLDSLHDNYLRCITALKEQEIQEVMD